MLEKMKETIKQKKSIVLDATFHNIKTRKLITKAAKEKDRICFIEITADENLTRQRLKRQRAYSEADFEVYKLIRRQWEPLNEPHLILESTDENMDSMLQKAVAYMEIKDDKRSNK